MKLSPTFKGRHFQKWTVKQIAYPKQIYSFHVIEHYNDEFIVELSKKDGATTENKPLGKFPTLESAVNYTHAVIATLVLETNENVSY